MMKIVGIGILAYILFALQLAVYRRRWNRLLGVTLGFSPATLFEGEQGELLEVVENRKRLPLPVLKVKFQTSRYLDFGSGEGSRTTDRYYRNDVFQVSGGERITRRLPFKALKRGYYKINGIDLIAQDMFLTTEMVENRDTEQYLHVFPRPYDSVAFRQSLQQLNGEMASRRHLIEDPFEYRGIREYQPYDDMRGVNWKATAKTGELQVNQKSHTALRSVRIFFNIEDNGILKKEECVEISLRIVAGLAESFLAQGIRVACYGNGLDAVEETPVAVEASAGSGQLDRIYRALARVDTGAVADFSGCFREKLLREADGTMTVLVAPNAYKPFCGLVEEYLAAGQECIWFYPVWGREEPELPARLSGTVSVLHIRD